MTIQITGDLAPEIRLRRIAEIINKGIYLLGQKEGWFISPKEKIRQSRSEVLSIDEELIINLCREKGIITNKDIHDLKQIHRNTATRILKKMVLKRLLFRNGKQRYTYYTVSISRIE